MCGTDRTADDTKDADEATDATYDANCCKDEAYTTTEDVSFTTEEPTIVPTGIKKKLSF